MKVLKFGSASIATSEKIRHVAKIAVKATKSVIVLSSMRGTAEALAEISNYLHKKNPEGAIEVVNRLEAGYRALSVDLFDNTSICEEANRCIKERFDYVRTFTQEMFTLFEERVVMAQGELISSDIFYLYMKQQGVKTALLPALDFIRVDRNQIPDSVYIKENLQRLISESPWADIYITQGYICRNSYGEIDDLRKGGTDFTASLVGAAIGAEEIQIWADVEVMHNGDPRYVKNTFPVRQLNFDEAAELAYFGAKILHPTRISPAKVADIPVRLKSTQNEEAPGTLITNESERGTIKAVAARNKITAIQIKSGEMLLAHGFLRKIFDVFERYQTPVDMIASSEVGIALTIDDDRNLEYIEDDLKRYGTLHIMQNMVVVSVVGDLGIEKMKFVATILDTIKDISVNMISYGGSKYNFSFLINENDKEQVLQLLNDRLF